MTYIVIETQTTGGVTAVVPPVSYTDRNQAEAKLHTVLAAAAVSQVEEHAAMILTSDGRVVRSECYRHPGEDPEINISD